jgi:hypothetical protein
MLRTGQPFSKGAHNFAPPPFRLHLRRNIATVMYASYERNIEITPARKN